jgi:uncharacterized protein (DUF924 family)
MAGQRGVDGAAGEHGRDFCSGLRRMSGRSESIRANGEDVLRFWFEEISPRQWWKNDPVLDHELKERFGRTHAEAVCCELSAWRGSARGRLAEIIVLDQFSRNIHRGDPRCFAADPLALCLAQHAVAAGADLELPPEQRSFLYMPFMHSESAVIHEEAVRLFGLRGTKGDLEYEHRHKAIIDRFGRYPHRNRILGRASTPEELEYLEHNASPF